MVSCLLKETHHRAPKSGRQVNIVGSHLTYDGTNTNKVLFPFIDTLLHISPTCSMWNRLSRLSRRWEKSWITFFFTMVYINCKCSYLVNTQDTVACYFHFLLRLTFRIPTVTGASQHNQRQKVFLFFYCSWHFPQRCKWLLDYADVPDKIFY